MVETLNNLQVGIALFDKQHAEIGNMLILFQEELEINSSKSRLQHMIELMLEKTKIHIDSEEELMFKLKFPGAEAHKIKHDEFLKYMSEFKRDFNRGLCNINLDHFVRDVSLWIIMHIKTKDKLYASFLKEHGY